MLVLELELVGGTVVEELVDEDDVLDDVEVLLDGGSVVEVELVVELVLVDVELLVEVDVLVEEDVLLEVDELLEVVEEDELEEDDEELLDEEDEELDDVELLDAGVTLTSGPMAEHRDSARMMSTAASGDSNCGSSRMCTARTVMLVEPGALFTICSLRMAVSTPGMVTTVFAAGVCASGLPPRAASTSVIDPVEPSPLDRHVLVTASAVIAFRPTTTSATLAELVANPE